MTYLLAELSFREFLIFTKGVSFEPISIDDINNKHQSLSKTITENFRPLPEFRKYLEVGYLPIIVEGEDPYLMKLEQVIYTIVDIDLACIAS